MRLRKPFILLAAACFLGGIAIAQGPRRDVGKGLPPADPPPAPAAKSPAAPPAPPVDADLVMFNVVVENKNGVPIRGLQKEQFKLFDGNVEQNITHFVSTDAPLTVAVAIEFSQVVYSVDNVLAPTAALVDSLGPEDWAALVSFDVRTNIVTDFTRNRAELLAGLQSLDRPVYREAALFDVVYDTLDRMENIDGRKALFVLGTGFDSISEHTLSQTLKKAESSDTMVYAVSMGQLTRIRLEGTGRIGFGNSIDYLAADNNMRQFAEATGGVVFFPRVPQDYPGIYGKLIQDLHSQYSIGFVPKNLKKDGKLHKLRVEVEDQDLDRDGRLDGLTARHKKGYNAPKR
ncbi:MAG TPA: VWA domain-containing protein [Terriglobia bacterium]|nr:VWA domain-containing protein [Terriglobia bacterium]